MNLPTWTVEFYSDARGHCPVRDFLFSLGPAERAMVLHVIGLLRDYGPLLRMPHARPVGGLWELHAGAGRVFYFAASGHRFVLLHGYRKQSQKAPKQELETARRRMADYLRRHP